MRGRAERQIFPVGKEIRVGTQVGCSFFGLALQNHGASGQHVAVMANVAFGQAQGPVRITLDEAIQMALQHNHNMLAARTMILQSQAEETTANRKSTRLNSSHLGISYAVFCLKK